MLKKNCKIINVLASAMLLVFSVLANAAVQKGPYLIFDGVNAAMKVLWQLDSSQSCTINWGENVLYSMGTADTVENGSGVYEHQHIYTITGLNPGTKYFYQVSCNLDNIGNGSFYTAPLDDADSVKLMVYGDTRSYPLDHDFVNYQMINTYTLDQEYQTITLHVGDWVNDGDLEADWANQFFDPNYLNTHEFQANIPINGCIGNHEGSGNLFYKYFPYLYQPGGLYWSFDYGPVHIAVIDQYVDYSPGSLQYIWLQNDLASSTKKWKFLVFHEPGWSAGGHSNNENVQNYIQPLAVENGVDIIFAGHNHYYARAAVDGIQHITTGGGGAPLYSPNPNAEYIVEAAAAYHFCEVDIQGEDLYFTARDNSGFEIDSFHLESPVDTDNDGITDSQDNCILIPNGPLLSDAGGNSQRDTDGDGFGNICDADLNQDLETDLSDFSLFRIAFSTTDDPDADLDGDGNVDLSDFSLFRVMFASPPGPSGLNP